MGVLLLQLVQCNGGLEGVKHCTFGPALLVQIPTDTPESATNTCRCRRLQDPVTSSQPAAALMLIQCPLPAPAAPISLAEAAPGRSWGYLVVWEAGCGEDRDLLASGDAVHDVDRRDACLDHLLRVDAAMGVDGLPWRMAGREGHGVRQEFSTTGVGTSEDRGGFGLDQESKGETFTQRGEGGREGKKEREGLWVHTYCNVALLRQAG